MAYENIETGETISDEEYQSRFGGVSSIQPEAPQQPSQGTGFLQRLKLSFGGQQAKQEQHDLESSLGLRGRPDIGDIADIAGAALPAAGAIGGSAFGLGGAALGAGVGKAAQIGIGKALGVREDTTPTGEVARVGGEVAGTYLGGKAIGYIASRVPKILGIFAGESPGTIAAALRDPALADKALQNGDELLAKAVAEAGKRSIQLKTQLIQGHKNAFEQLAGNSTKKLANRTEIVNDFQQILKSRGATIGKGGKLDFGRSKIVANPGEISKISDAYNAIRSWKDWTLGGMNELKQLVGELTKFATETGKSSKSPALGTFYHTIDRTIKTSLNASQRTRYETMNSNFSKNIEMFDDMVEAFNKGDPFKRIAGVFSQNNAQLRKTIEFFEKKSGKRIFPIVAGRKIGEEREAAFGFLNPRDWVDLLLSPSAQGKAFLRPAQVIQPALQTVKKGLSAYQKYGQNVARSFLGRSVSE